MKLNRNDLCWCGSQKKYKKCHLAFDEKLEQLRFGKNEGNIIHYCAQIGKPKIIEKLYFNGFDINYKDVSPAFDFKLLKKLIGDE